MTCLSQLFRSDYPNNFDDVPNCESYHTMFSTITRFHYFLGTNNNLIQACNQNINTVDAAAPSVGSYKYIVYLRIKCSTIIHILYALCIHKRQKRRQDRKINILIT
jgi:hypothetical protein